MNRGNWGVLVAVVLVVGMAGACLAGAMYRNDSGAVARAVRIEFSEPAEVTSMYPSFPQRDPQGPATVIVLSGGEIASGGWFSFTWRPDSARVVKIDWFASPPSSARPNLGFSEPKGKPEVHGQLLNPAFFAHPAYVMQGVSERDKIFALSLQGVPELAFYPVLGDLPASSLTWTHEVSHPAGVGAVIEDGTLYIWGSNPEWQGYGEVHLHVSAPDGRASSVTIPVVVFCSDRTLVNPDGKKDYFVPWGVILDINRILSVEEHMRQYDKPDLGLLDRTLRFSKWRAMEPWYGALVSAFWPSDLDLPTSSWQRSAQYALVDVRLMELRELGFRTVTIHNYYWTTGLEGTAIRQAYTSPPHSVGASKDKGALRYFVNEAHRNGLRVIVSPVVLADNRLSSSLPIAEMWQATPIPPEAFWESYRFIVLELMTEWTSLGLDVASVCNDLEILGPQTMENTGLTDRMLTRLAAEVRNRYPGPLIAYTSFFFGPRQLKDAAFLRAVDIVAWEIYNPEGGKPLTLTRL